MLNGKYIYAVTAIILSIACSPGPHGAATAADLDTLNLGGSLKDNWSCACGAVAAGPVQGIFDSYPKGGPEFSERLTAILIDEPSLALDVICASLNGNLIVAPQAAKALAMAQLTVARNNPALADQIGAWLSCAPPAFQAAYYDAQMTGKLTHLLVPYVPDGPGGGVISPSRP